MDLLSVVDGQTDSRFVKIQLIYCTIFKDYNNALYTACMT